MCSSDTLFFVLEWTEQREKNKLVKVDPFTWVRGPLKNIYTLGI